MFPDNDYQPGFTETIRIATLFVISWIFTIHILDIRRIVPHGSVFLVDKSEAIIYCVC